MNDIGYERAASVADAIRLAAQPGASFVAGGTNLLDLMKGHVAMPTLLVDVSRLPLATVVPRSEGGVRIEDPAAAAQAIIDFLVHRELV